MKRKTASRISPNNTGSRRTVESWHGDGDIEIRQYTRSIQSAAKTLVGSLDLDQNSRTDWDAAPVVLLYRQALELHLKLLVGEGSGFLPSPTDPISLSTTRSLRWLAQIVGQIVRAVGWESEFKCEGASSLAEFTALVNEVEIFDPVARIVRSSRNPQSVSEFYRTFDIFNFSRRLDAVLNLLDSTADALAAEWDLRGEAAVAEIGGHDFDGGDGGGPMIQ
jgi:hypothetical protein